MPISSALDSTSFSALNRSGTNAVYGLFGKYRKGNRLALDIDNATLFSKRKSLTVSLDYYGGRIEKINPASFKYLTSQQKVAYLQELLFAFYILSAQYQLDYIESRRQTLKDRSKQLQHCAYLIEELKKKDKQSPEEIIACAVADAGKHAKYLGLTVVAPFLAEKMMELISNQATIAPVKQRRTKQWEGAGKTEVIRNWMNEINGLRLYWVWGGGLLNTVLSMLPDDFANTPQAQQGVAAPAPITGYMSWILYYARFGINLALLLKHTFKGPWMSDEEKNLPISTWDRFKTQWDQRKFALLNDSIWGVANMVCFFWLTGGGMLGYYGNIATALLLLMDVTLTVWKFYEESTQYNVNLQRYNADIALLQAKIAAETSLVAKELFELQLADLKKAKKQCELDWQYKKYGLTNDLVYAVALLVAFSLMCCFLFPPAAMVPAAAVILGITGAALCFVLNAVNAAIKGALEIGKVQQTHQSVKREYQVLLDAFLALDDEGENLNKKKKLYLDMQQLLAESDYQQQLINFQKVKLVRSILIDALVPPLVFVSFVFMPMGIGIAVLAAGLALALITNYILKRFEPQAPKLPAMNDEEYNAFAANPTGEVSDVPPSSPPAIKWFKFWGTSSGYARVPTEGRSTPTSAASTGDSDGIELTGFPIPAAS